MASLVLALIMFAAEPLRPSAQAPVVVRFEPMAQRFALGDPVCVRLTIENISEGQLLLPRGVFIVTSLSESGNLDFPETLLEATLVGPGGQAQGASPKALQGTATVTEQSFIFLASAEKVSFAWDLTSWPWLFSFTESGSYSLNAKLHFVALSWLDRMQRETITCAIGDRRFRCPPSEVAI